VPVGQEHLPGAVDLDPLQGRRSSKVLVARNRLLKSTFRPRPRVAADTIVRSLSGDADALLDCYNEKVLQMRAFFEAAEGIRTLDILHGKQWPAVAEHPEMPANRVISAGLSPGWVSKNCAESQGFRQGTDNETDTGPFAGES
jgi:hypothetical protein